MLGVLCGLRRGEIVALRWRNVDLAAVRCPSWRAPNRPRQACGTKPPKSGRARTVALSARLSTELRRTAKQAEELLRLGMRQTDATFVYAREDGEPMQPRSLTQHGAALLARICRASGFTICAMPTRRTCFPQGVHPKVASERLGHSQASGSRSISTATCCRGCRKMPPPALTTPINRAREARRRALGSNSVANG